MFRVLRTGTYNSLINVDGHTFNSVVKSSVRLAHRTSRVKAKFRDQEEIEKGEKIDNNIQERIKQWNFFPSRRSRCIYSDGVKTTLPERTGRTHPSGDTTLTSSELTLPRPLFRTSQRLNASTRPRRFYPA